MIVASAKLRPLVHVPLTGASTLSTDSDKGTEQIQMEQHSTPGRSAWEIDVWGRVRSQRAAVEENYEAIALDYAFARQSIAATTARSWYLAIEAHQLLALRQRAWTFTRSFWELVKMRRTAGKVADLDVAEANFNSTKP